jgi:hypothetical protein
MKSVFDDPKRMLRYWRNCLADGLLSGLQKETLVHAVEWKQVAAGQIHQHLAQNLLRDARQRWSDHQATVDEQSIGTRASVLIAPLVFYPTHMHGIAKREQSAPYAPLIIPGFVGKGGDLTIVSKDLPWFVRDALEPSGSNESAVGTLDSFDQFRSTRLPLIDKWSNLIAYVEELCEAVAGAKLDQVSIERYRRGKPLIQAGRPPPRTTRHLIRLADYIIDHEAKISGPLAALIEARTPEGLLSEERRQFLRRAHVGQMGGLYPLSDLQREALHHVLACEAGDILAVNGPPGTGKTTLVQSVSKPLCCLRTEGRQSADHRGHLR